MGFIRFRGSRRRGIRRTKKLGYWIEHEKTNWGQVEYSTYLVVLFTNPKQGVLERNKADNSKQFWQTSTLFLIILVCMWQKSRRGTLKLALNTMNFCLFVHKPFTLVTKKENLNVIFTVIRKDFDQLQLIGFQK